MLPVVYDFGPFQIHTYGLMMVIGFVAGILVMRFQAHREGIDANQFTDILFWSFICGLLGGKILFVITTWDYYSKHLLDIFILWQGGLVFYGGFIGGVLGLYLLTRYRKISFIKALDLSAPSLALGHFFGRLGCFSAGCCHGSEVSSDFPLSVVFTHPLSAAPRNIHLHPAQLYDAFNVLIVFFILQWVFRRKKFDGQVIALYGILYGIGRFIVEIFRGDDVRGFLWKEGLSTSQFLALLFVLSFSVFYFYKRKKTTA